MVAVPYTGPSPTDFSICSSYYGTGLSNLECFQAAGRLPNSPANLVYQVRTEVADPYPFVLSLPSSRIQGQSPKKQPLLRQRLTNI